MLINVWLHFETLCLISGSRLSPSDGKKSPLDPSTRLLDFSNACNLPSVLKAHSDQVCFVFKTVSDVS